MGLRIAGAVLVLFGLFDMLGSWGGIDVWGDVIGITLPEIIWRFTAYIEIGLGIFIWNLGGSQLAEE